MPMLIVEDDVRIAGFVTKGLEQSGYPCGHRRSPCLARPACG
jgi:DNA-binding response OmpR family regulator